MGRPKSENRQRTEFLGVRMLPEEYHAVLAAAHNRGVTVGEFVRQAVRSEMEVRR